MTHPFIRIDKCTPQRAWYANRIGQLFAIEWEERNERPDQGLPADVYWVRTGGVYNCLQWVLQSDATKVPDSSTHLHEPIITEADHDLAATVYRSHVDKLKVVAVFREAAELRGQQKECAIWMANTKERRDETLNDLEVRLANANVIIAQLKEEGSKDLADLRRLQGDVIRLTHEGNDLRREWDEARRERDELTPSVEVYVNNRLHAVMRKVDYDIIVRLANLAEPQRLHTVTYYSRRNVGHMPIQGSLTPGQSVTAVKGMVFTCVYTGNA